MLHPSSDRLISIIIPTLNSVGCIGRCLASVREQTCLNYEVVIIDGGSTDGTLREIEEHALSCPRVTWRSGKDRGIYDAMNKGVALARGDWLLFLGADDALYAPDVLDQITRHLSPDYDFVYGNTFSASASSWAEANVIYDGEFDDAKILERNICHQAIFYSRALFARYGGYNLSYKVLADWEFNLRIFRSVKKKFVDLIIARFEGGGTSTVLVDHEFRLRFPEIADRAFGLPLRAAFYRQRLPNVVSLAELYWKRRQPLRSLRFFWIWLLNASAGDIREQARKVWRARREGLHSP